MCFKEDTTTQIVEAIHTVLKGDYFVSSSQATRLLGHLYKNSQKEEKDPIDRLSNRELEVFLMIGEGMPVKEIAANMGLAASTIETLRSRIKTKLSITENEKLIRIAVEWKIHTGKNGTRYHLIPHLEIMIEKDFSFSARE
jgi:DNA-binding NarL/FixJ family response regulator